ncbi:hypothetical protein IscW_ISCW022903, partial [Ixodes scapularis]
RCIPNLQTREIDKTSTVRLHSLLVSFFFLIFWHEQQINVEENLKYEGGRGGGGGAIYKTGKGTLMHTLVDHYGTGQGKYRICNKGEAEERERQT